MTYSVKREKIEKKVIEEQMRRSEEMEWERIRGIKLFKRIIGVALVVVAALFGKVLGGMPTGAIFGVVFTYLSIQAALWLT